MFSRVIGQQHRRRSTSCGPRRQHGRTEQDQLHVARNWGEEPLHRGKAAPRPAARCGSRAKGAPASAAEQARRPHSPRLVAATAAGSSAYQRVRRPAAGSVCVGVVSAPVPTNQEPLASADVQNTEMLKPIWPRRPNGDGASYLARGSDGVVRAQIRAGGDESPRG